MNVHSNSEPRRPMRAMSSNTAAGVIRQCVAVVLVGALPAVCSPALAGDFVAQRFNVSSAGLGVTLGLRSVSSEPGLPGPGTQLGIANANAAFTSPAPAPQQPPQPASPPPPAQHGSLTTKGKVLKWVGVGLMGSGGLTAGLGAAEYSSGNCNSQIIINCSEVRTAVIATGAAIAGVGAVLFFIGIHNRE
jgi:hypothetical protein